jgi:probable F420-dependent oxidoreductase
MTPTTALGPLGIATGPAPADAAALEDAGARTLWLAGGAIDRLERLTALLDGTRDAVVVPGIVPTGVYPASAVAAVHADAARRHPGRYLTGLGAPQQPGALDALHRHLDELDALGLPTSQRLLAALGPRKLDLARTRCAGAVTLLVTPEHTARARAALGTDRLLAVMLPTVLGTDRTGLRELAGFLLDVPGYRAAVRGMGFTDAEIDTRADRLLDAVAARGDRDDIVARMAEHRAAGADHVVLSPVGDPGSGAALLRALR